MLSSAIKDIICAGNGFTRGAVTLRPDVILVVAPDESGRLFDLDGFFYAVSSVGTKMLRCALTQDRERSLSILAQLYRISVEQLTKDYDALLCDLEAKGLIYSCEKARHTNQCTTSLFSRKLQLSSRKSQFLLGLILGFIHRLPLSQRTWMLLALARLGILLFGWDKTVRAWLSSHSRWDRVPETSMDAIRHAVRAVAAKHVVSLSCKERSLCCWSLCKTAGIPAAIVLGISLFPLASHCWCRSGEDCLTDFPDRCECFTPVLVYE
jgi:Transglutaminase-like superfamily